MAKIEARVDSKGAVNRRRSTGLWEPVEPRTDWTRVDATTEAQIERQAAFDDAEAAKDAAAWARRVRRRAGLSQAEFARRIGMSVVTVRDGNEARPCRTEPPARCRPGSGSRIRAERRLSAPATRKRHNLYARNGSGHLQPAQRVTADVPFGEPKLGDSWSPSPCPRGKIPPATEHIRRGGE